MPDLDLLDRRRGQRDPDGVADALAEQRTEGGRRLDRALERRPGLGDAEVQRPVAGLGEQLVGPHHHDGVVVLDRDLEVVEVVLLEERGLPDGRLDERLRRGLAVLLHLPLVERPRVDADPDRGAVVLGGLGDLLDLVVELLDVAGVHAYGGTAGLDRGEDVLRLEVDVGDHRDLRLLRDRRKRLGVVRRGAGDPDDVAAGGGELGDLLERALTSAVSVVVIDCTETGCSLPTPTLPTWICRVGRRGASTGGGAAGMPRGRRVGPRHDETDSHVS